MIKRLSIILIVFTLLFLSFIKPIVVRATSSRFSWHWPNIIPVTLVTTSTKPTTKVLAMATDNVQAFILSQINQYRAGFGLTPVQPGPQTCNFAAIRAKEISTDFSHTLFTKRVNNHTLPYTTWMKVTENLAETSDYQRVVMLWKNSPEHALNMRANTPYVCVVKYGNYYAYEGLNP